MRFRTEIEPLRSGFRIDGNAPVVLLGSCFSDEIGSRLMRDGFEVCKNPFGPLYNPLSIENCIARACLGSPYTAADLTSGPRGWHCLDYASRFSGADATALLDEINTTLGTLRSALLARPVVIVTLGSAFVYALLESGRTVGNCHKFPADVFSRHLLTVAEIENAVEGITVRLREAGVRHIIFTVSPIRHLADGLHGNTVSKASLLVALNDVLTRHGDFCTYFPSYEILLDDLRDYRFYASDMKHPSDVAADYIYEKFTDTFFDKAAAQAAIAARKSFLAAQHRPILQ